MSAQPRIPLSDPNHPMRWKHRRRMAYLSLWAMLVATAWCLTPWIAESRIAVLTDALGWFYFAMASIVGAYVGFATWAEKK